MRQFFSTFLAYLLSFTYLSLCFPFPSFAIDSVTDTVDLSTGDVSFPIDLLTLSGRNGFSKSLSLKYSSNVQLQATTWNLEEPTSIVGLGWGLSREQIIRETNGTVATDDDSYLLILDGEAKELTYKSTDGQGYRLYYTKDFSFWTISYNPSFEQWTVTTEDGMQHIFGGGLTASKDPQSKSQGASIQWGVGWGNWTGNSVQLTNQVQFPLVWNISQLKNTAGEIIHFSYQQETESVGTQGLLYSKACYLSTIQTATGEIAKLNYQTKAPNEFQDPHQLEQTSQSIIKLAGGITSEGSWDYLSAPDISLSIVVTPSSGGSSQTCNIPEKSDSFTRTFNCPSFKFPSSVTNVNILVTATDNDTLGSNEVMISKTFSSLSCPAASDSPSSLTAVSSSSSPYAKLDLKFSCSDLQPEPDAFQEHFETQYLDRIDFLKSTASNSNPTLLSSVQLKYDLLGRKNALDSANKRDKLMVKRILTGIVFLNSNALPIAPGYRFTYFGQSPTSASQNASDGTYALASSQVLYTSTQSGNGALYGALHTVTSPEGGVLTYNYGSQSIPSASRTLTVNPGANWANPRAYFGADFVVATWQGKGSSQGQINISTYTWEGRWIENSYVQTPSSNSTYPVDVQIGTEFFTVATSGDKPTVTAYSKGLSEPGAWNMFAIPLTLSQAPQVELGDKFIAILDSSNTISVFERNGNSWAQAQAFPVTLSLASSVTLFAENNTILVAGLTKKHTAQLSLYYRTETGSWLNDSQEISNYINTNPPAEGSTSYSLQMVGNSFGAALQIHATYDPPPNPYGQTPFPSTYMNYRYTSNWSVAQDTTSVSLSVPSQLGEPTTENTITPIVLQQSTLAFPANPLIAFRYDGASWGTETKISNSKESDLDFISSDIIIASDSSWGTIDSKLTQFDPNLLEWQATDVGFTSTDIQFVFNSVMAVLDVGLLFIPEVPLVFDVLANVFLSFVQPPTEGFEARELSGLRYLFVGSKIYYFTPQGKWNYLDSNLSSRLPSCSKNNTSCLLYSTIGLSDSFFVTMTTKTTKGSSRTTSLTNIRNEIVALKNGGIGNQQKPLYLETSASATSLTTQPSDNQPQLSGGDTFIAYPIQNPSPRSYYSSDDFANANQFTLFRYVADNISGNLNDYYVNRISVSDGLNPISYYHFTFNASTATMDPLAATAFYNQAIVTPSGASSSIDPSNGSTEHYFYNRTRSPALAPSASGTNSVYSDLNQLAGAEYYTRTCPKGPSCSEGNKVQSTLTTFSSFSTIVNGTISGTYIRPTSIVMFQDGAITTTNFAYSATTGLTASTSSTSINGNGQKETVLQSLTYGADVYTALLDRNILTPVVESRTSVNGLVVSATATTWSNYFGDSWAPLATYSLINGNGETDFLAWGASDTPSSAWRKSAQYTYSSYGSLVSKENNKGQNTSYLYDQQESLLIAGFTYADVGNDEANYLGFESYEDVSKWEISGGSLTSNGYRHNGIGALTSSNTSKLSLRLTSFSPNSSPYVVSAWVKANSNSTCKIGFLNGNNWLTGSSTSNTSITSWQYLESFASEVASGSIPTVSCSAGGSIDDAVVAPVNSTYLANVYDNKRARRIATLIPNGGVTRTIYDENGNVTASVGPDSNLTDLNIFNYSRCKSVALSSSAPSGTCSDNGSVNFNQVSPNTNVSVLARSGGEYINFETSGLSGRYAWSIAPSNVATISKSGISLKSYNRATATYSNPGRGNYGVRAKILPESASNIEFALGIGNTSVGYSNGSFSLFSGTSKVAGPVSVPYSDDWMLVVNGNTTFFFLQGKPLLQYSNPSNTQVSGSLFFSARSPVQTEDSVSVTINNIAIFYDPILTINYSDGFNSPVQTQVLESGNSSIVSETLYDALGRAAITTKPARITGNLGYSSTFATMNTSNNLMAGDVSTAYPNDNGYPYARKTFETNPLSRVVESAVPGANNAIGTNRTTKFSYGVTSDVAALVQSKLGVSCSVGNCPNFAFSNTSVPTSFSARTAHTEVTNASGQALFDYARTSSASIISSNNTSYQSGNIIDTISLPNYFAPPNRQSASLFQVTQQQNLLGELLSQSSPADSGTTLHRYDSMGRERFALDQRGSESSPNTVLYWKYDVNSRVIEEGFLQTNDWNDSSLSSNLDAQSWPETPPTWRNKFIYDYAPNSSNTGLNLVGRLYQVQSNTDNDNDAELIETYSYDIAGNITRVTTISEDFDSGVAHVTAYTYDHLGNILTITYPAIGNASPISINYSYNSLAQVTQVGTNESPNAFATYSYTAFGTVYKETLAPTSYFPNVRTYSYNSPMQVQQISDSFFKEAYTYATSSQYQNGNTLALNYSPVTAAFGSISPEPYTYSFTYDAFERVLTGSNAQFSSSNMTIGTSANNYSDAYDANGNVLNSSFGTTSNAYTYVGNKATGTSSMTLSSDPNGNVTNNNGKKINLIRDTYSTKAIQISSQTTTSSYQCLPDNVRVLKTVSYPQSSQTTQRLYLHGNNNYPLVEQAKGLTNSSTIYIYGPNGVIAAGESLDSLNYISKDKLGSVRVVFNPQANTGSQVVQYFNFTPFGALMSTNSSPISSLRYGFTGQEYEPESGLYNFRSRFYDAEIGRFYSVDPARQYASPYLYVNEDPEDGIDKSGDLSFKGIRNLASDPVKASKYEAEASKAFRGTNKKTFKEVSEAVLKNGNDEIAKYEFDKRWKDNDFAVVADVQKGMEDIKNASDSTNKLWSRFVNILRPGTRHEYFPVSKARELHALGLSVEDVQTFSIPTADMVFEQIGVPGSAIPHPTSGVYNVSGSTLAHKETYIIIDYCYERAMRKGYSRKRARKSALKTMDLWQKGGIKKKKLLKRFNGGAPKYLVAVQSRGDFK